MLRELERVFSQHALSDMDVQLWKRLSEALRLEAKQSYTIICVVSYTAASKSSVINAVLDMKRLIPTNHMRACTAVATEICWNDSADASARYRAEIELIGREEWENELSFLMQDFLAATGMASFEAFAPDIEASVA
jgi:hypothetical protein